MKFIDRIQRFGRTEKDSSQIQIAGNIFPTDKMTPVYIESTLVFDENGKPSNIDIDAYNIKTDHIQDLLGGAFARNAIDNNFKNVEIDDTPIAKLISCFQEDAYIIDNVRVNKDYIRQGIGSTLIKTAEDMAYGLKVCDTMKAFNILFPSDLKFVSNKDGFINKFKDFINSRSDSGFDAYNAFLKFNGLVDTQNTFTSVPEKQIRRTAKLQPDVLAFAIGTDTTPYFQIFGRTIDVSSLVNATNDEPSK